MEVKTILEQRLSFLDRTTAPVLLAPVGGGSINQTFSIQVGGRRLFCKINSAAALPDMFLKEKNGLALLAQQNLIHTPGVVDLFNQGGLQFLLLEWIAEGDRTNTFWQRFGEQLAALHRVTGKWYRLHENNYMGSVPQRNTRHENWFQFFAEERLQPLIDRCVAKNLLSTNTVQAFETLIRKLPLIFDKEPPALLHGDLWSGNFMCNTAAEPVLIDPAVYFGHRSMDLGMTTLFGGFPPSFYEAYHYYFPLHANYKEQWAVCSLYPLLIHLYLFGAGYRPGIEQTLKQFC